MVSIYVLSCVQLFVTPWTITARLLCPWKFPGKNTGVGCHFLLQGIFPTQGLNLCLLYWQSDSLLLRKSHGWRSLVACSPWGREESDMTEQLPFHFSLSCIGEGNGNPLQCSWLENPRDGGAWWAAVYGVAQSWTRLKRLSSSSSSTWEAPYVVTDLSITVIILQYIQILKHSSVHLKLI